MVVERKSHLFDVVDVRWRGGGIGRVNVRTRTIEFHHPAFSNLCSAKSPNYLYLRLSIVIE